MSAADKAKHLARSYGLTIAQVEQMRADPGGVCAVCTSGPAAHVDHDHSTGSVRGLLCFRCNAALGQLGDDPAVIRRAAAYIERMSRLAEVRESAPLTSTSKGPTARRAQ